MIGASQVIPGSPLVVTITDGDGRQFDVLASAPVSISIEVAGAVAVPPPSSPRMDFSEPMNSQYLPLLAA